MVLLLLYILGKPNTGQKTPSSTCYILFTVYSKLLLLIYTFSCIVTDLVSRIVQVLKGDLYWVKISAQEAGLMEPVEP